LTPEEAVQIERVCDAFEVAWKAGMQTPIESYLADVSDRVRRELLRELVELEVAYRTRRGERPTLGEYLRRFPDELTAAYLAETPLADADSAIMVGSGASTISISPTTATSTASPWPLVPGYEIVDVLGRGGMGVVYKAIQLGAKRLVALKMIRDGVLASPEHRVRFRIEAEAAARFQHPNLVRIYEVGEQAGLPYFSMELAEGGSLDKRLADGPLAARQAAELARTLAEAVQYAHDKKIVHRDLKPANVVLTADGRPLITDFGLAKRLDSDTIVTGSDAILGTASYMAPEQADGQAKQVGPAGDVYSLGAILYELLTGEPPFRAEGWQATVKLVVHEEPVPPTELRPDVPSDLETICLKCLEKDAGRRYTSAHDLATDLTRFLAGESIAAAPTSDLEREKRWASKAGFEIEETLLSGLGGAVYKARQVHLNRIVALRVIRHSASTDAALGEQLRGQAATVAQLDHPNIVRIYDSGELHGRIYLAFEHVAGGSLAQRFGDEAIPPREAAQLMQRLAEAVQYAHQKGIVHGALRLSTVLLTPDGVPKITNFGLSLHPEASRATLWQRIPLRAEYAAPEVKFGQREDLSPAADVYSLGAIFYKLLTGKSPRQEEAADKSRQQGPSRWPPVPSASRPEVPAALDRICQKCLARKADKRYASAGEMADELGRFLAAEQAKPTGGEPLPEFQGYDVMRELGRGSLSVVYEARQKDLGRMVAIRTMQQDIRYGKPLRVLFRDMAESVARLQHPHIVEVYECRELNGRFCFIMELLTRGSLDHRPAGQMPVTEAAALVRTLARTMEAVHQQGIIHGNLKPSKVLLATDGTPKITGFIISRKQRALLAEDQANMTVAAPMVMGTPRYMAPEQLAGETGAISPATDVYALGLILYELLTGWLPFRAATLWEMMAQVLREPAQSPCVLRPNIPPGLEAICLRCLAKKPSDRYARAEDLADDLDQFLAGKPLISWSVLGPPPLPAKAVPPHAGFWARLVAWWTGHSTKTPRSR
jgi:serine/threonine protein kinase